MSRLISGQAAFSRTRACTGLQNISCPHEAPPPARIRCRSQFVIPPCPTQRRLSENRLIIPDSHTQLIVSPSSNSFQPPGEKGRHHAQAGHRRLSSLTSTEAAVPLAAGRNGLSRSGDDCDRRTASESPLWKKPSAGSSSGTRYFAQPFSNCPAWRCRFRCFLMPIRRRSRSLDPATASNEREQEAQIAERFRSAGLRVNEIIL